MRERMLQLNYSYSTCIAGSERANWTLDEVFPIDEVLDLARPVLPRELTGASELGWLSADEERALNQITGHSYANLFAFVEEFILAAMIDQAREQVHGDHTAVRALLRVAEEEVKHQRLFERYRGAFRRDFGHECEVLTSARDVAGRILEFHPLAILLLTLHLELVTQRHYVESVKTCDSLEPAFARLLKAHWIEEAQHARIDALELQRMLSAADQETIEGSFGQYEEMLHTLLSILGEQAKMDRASLQNALGRSLRAGEASELEEAQHRTYGSLFIDHGVTNPTFLRLVDRISPHYAASVRAFRSAS